MPVSSGAPQNTKPLASRKYHSPPPLPSMGQELGSSLGSEAPPLQKASPQSKMNRQSAIWGGAFLHKGDRRTSEEQEESLRVHLRVKVTALAGIRQQQFGWSPRPQQDVQQPGEQRSRRNVRQCVRFPSSRWPKDSRGTTECPSSSASRLSLEAVGRVLAQGHCLGHRLPFPKLYFALRALPGF
ncbi:uncharacterized protein LOC116576768 isoform X2 [Mustela erminea]|uniref:uncharacterized protein LOC116576768 isoform X2 n=1 Tax=Mustela erminea TaxID=36723 RepID=UPI0013872430|nr:uncharacterized protein LOC116576768 isoform X2 [Mustela erminea]